MNWLQGILLGVITGISEFFPISAPAHKELMKHLVGAKGNDPILDLLCSLAALLALLTANRSFFEMLRRDQRLTERHSRVKNNRGSRDLRVVKKAMLPMIFGYIFLTYISNNIVSFPVISALLLINGIILFLPTRMLQGNKDARSMSALDSLLLGLTGAISALPGFSRIALQTTVVRIRGADSTHALNWALLLSIPALITTTAISLLALATGFNGIRFSCGFFTYLLVFLGTYIGSYLSIFFVKILAHRNNLSLFAYYSWGAALFVFIMYLI